MPFKKTIQMEDSPSAKLWDADRLRRIGSVMDRYSTHIAEGHRIRLGMEGDPCTPYRNADDAPRGTVVHVEPKQDDGAVRFTIRLDGQDDLLPLDNRTIDPCRVWEIDPMFVSAFRASLQQSDEGTSKWDDDESGDGDTFRGETEQRFSHLSTRISEMENTNTDFRSATASTLRYIAADLLRLSHGESLEFANHYADRYDLAVDPPQDGYRAVTDAVSHERSFRARSVGQEEVVSVVSSAVTDK